MPAASEAVAVSVCTVGDVAQTVESWPFTGCGTTGHAQFGAVNSCVCTQLVEGSVIVKVTLNAVSMPLTTKLSSDGWLTVPCVLVTVPVLTVTVTPYVARSAEHAVLVVTNVGSALMIKVSGVRKVLRQPVAVLDDAA